MIASENQCALCGNKPADRGLMCATCRAEDDAIAARTPDAKKEPEK